MPEMIPLGWFHTILGIGAVVSGFYTLIKYRVVSLTHRSGKLYVLLTLIVAGTALGIYNQGGFGIAHNLALLTLVALAGGVGDGEDHTISVRFQNTARHSVTAGTLLFHMIPAITDFLRRLPIGDPFIDTLDDPLLRQFHLAFLAIFVVGVIAQVLWLRKSSQA
jgi:uncharacterized membrane protein